jgi:hypothetical protein
VGELSRSESLFTGGPKLFCGNESGEGRRGDDLAIAFAKEGAADDDDDTDDAVGDAGTEVETATLPEENERFTSSPALSGYLEWEILI